MSSSIDVGIDNFDLESEQRHDQDDSSPPPPPPSYTQAWAPLFRRLSRPTAMLVFFFFISLFGLAWRTVILWTQTWPYQAILYPPPMALWQIILISIVASAFLGIYAACLIAVIQRPGLLYPPPLPPPSTSIFDPFYAERVEESKVASARRSVLASLLCWSSVGAWGVTFAGLWGFNWSAMIPMVVICLPLVIHDLLIARAWLKADRQATGYNAVMSAINANLVPREPRMIRKYVPWRRVEQKAMLPLPLNYQPLYNLRQQGQ